jgi:hypothetical protein
MQPIAGEEKQYAKLVDEIGRFPNVFFVSHPKEDPDMPGRKNAFLFYVKNDMIICRKVSGEKANLENYYSLNVLHAKEKQICTEDDDAARGEKNEKHNKPGKKFAKKDDKKKSEKENEKQDEKHDEKENEKKDEKPMSEEKEKKGDEKRGETRMITIKQVQNKRVKGGMKKPTEIKRRSDKRADGKDDKQLEKKCENEDLVYKDYTKKNGKRDEKKFKPEDAEQQDKKMDIKKDRIWSTQ